MKLKTVLIAAIAGGTGYVLGTKAGRARFEELRGKAQDFLGSPQVQETVANLSDTVKQNTHKLPDPVAGVVNAAADKVKGSTTEGTDVPEPTFSEPTFTTGPTDPSEPKPTPPQ